MTTAKANECNAEERYMGMSGKTDYKAKYVERVGSSMNNRDSNLRNTYNLSRDNDFKRKEKEFRNKNNSFRPRDNELRRTKYSNSSFLDKDEEENNNNIRGRKASGAKARNTFEMDLEPMDKLETLRRLEREKKIMQKKREEEEQERPRKANLKQKRARKDLAKNYEYGLLGDDDY